MNKIYALLLITVFSFVAKVQAQVTVSGASAGNGSYTTLAAAFTAINTATGTISIAITGNTTEPVGGAVLNNAVSTTITISPSGGAARTITGAATAGLPLIDLSGAKRVTFNGLNTGGNSLTISNTTVSATSGTATIRFIADATNNTVTNCTVLGSFSASVTTNGGNIFFSTGTTTGNDNNTISNNLIGPAGANLPTKGIYGNGSTTSVALNNSGISISGNSIYDYFGAAVTSAGLYVGTGNIDWTIDNNKFFQTAARTQTTGTQHSAIWIANTVANTSGNNFAITNNTIGYASSTPTGTYGFVGVSGSTLVPLFLSVPSTISNTSVQGNTIAGIAISGACAGTSSSAPFRGIYVSGGIVAIGDVTANTIGSMTATGSITYTTTSASTSDVIGIFNFGLNAFTTSNNNIGGISVANTSTAAANFYGLRVNTSSATTWTCTNNTIGGTIASSISSSSASTVQGILVTAPAATVTGNVIQNLTSNNGTGTTTGASVIGISVTATSANHTVSQNTIRNLSNSAAAAAVTVCGIQFNSSTGTNTIARNAIHSLDVTSATGIINGINVSGGTATYSNNVIRLGIKSDGSSLTSTTALISGISEPLGTDNFYHNTIYIGGTSITGTNATYAFNSTQTVNTRNFRNNLFVNARSNSTGTGKHYAVRVGGTAANPSGLTINYNSYYISGTGGVFGFFNSADVANLAAWKTVVGQDANSSELDPKVLSPTGTFVATNLSINTGIASQCEAGGVAGTGVTDDYSGALRSGLTPVDIGAFGFNGTAFPACIAPTAQPTSIAVSNVASTSADISFTAASPVPSGYLVVATTGAAPTAPVTGTTYSIGSTALGASTLVVGNVSGTSLTASGLTASTSYTFYVYSYNNTACASGPVYLTTSPLVSASVATCGAAPVSSAATVILGTGFTANWATVAGATGYFLDVSTSSVFATFVTGYSNQSVGNVLTYNVTGLTAFTTYYYRVRATNGTCTTSSSGNITATTIGAVPWTEGFATTTLPTGWTNTSWGSIGTTTGLTGNTGNVFYKNLYSSATTGTFITPAFGSIPAGSTFFFDYKLQNFSSPYAVPATGWGSFQFQISVNGGAYSNIGSSFTASPAAFSTQSIDLSPYSGQKISLQMNATWTTGDYYLYFDNFAIYAPCAAPASPTSMVQGATGPGTMVVSFTPNAAPPDGYMVVRYPTGSTVTAPTNGVTTYATGQSLGLGIISNIVAGAASSFTIASLAPSTSYDVHVYPYSITGCTGGPVFGTKLSGINYTTAGCPSLLATINIGASGDYPNLSGAANILNGCPVTQATVVQLNSDYNPAGETLPVIFLNNTGASATNTITIRPNNSTSFTITGSSTSPLIDFQGAKYYILDGRAGGTGTTRALTITNSGNGPALRLYSDAQNDQVIYTNFVSSNTSATTGVVRITSANGTTSANGNNNITISNCGISGNGLSPNGIYAAGSAAPADNKSITISNNDIYDYFSDVASVNNYGIFLGGNNGVSASSAWTISGNSFYQTTSRAYNASAGIVSAIGGGFTPAGAFTITGNKIGGTATNLGGSALTYTGTSAYTFSPMNLLVGGAGATTISGNTIANTSVTTASTLTTHAAINLSILNGITATISGNTIGSTTAAGSIAFTGGSSAVFSGINAGVYYGSQSGAINATGNTIAGISLPGITNTNSFNGINYGTANTATAVSNISSNIIGATSGPVTNASPGNVTGIVNTNVIGATINSNQITNLNSTNAGSSVQVRGINSGNATGSNTINSNTISNINSAAANTSTTTAAAMIGLLNIAPASSISNNTISGLTGSGNAAVNIYGIYNNNSVTTANANFVYGLLPSNVGATAAVVTGLYINGGTSTYSNNLISLGQGDAIAHVIYGINDLTGINSTYYNSIYLGGTGVGTIVNNTFAYRSSNTGIRIVQNNAFQNARSNTSTGGNHYAVNVAGTTPLPSGLTLDNNDYFANGTGGVFGLYNAADVATLAAWKTAVGLDGSSFGSNPNFTNPTAATPNLSINTGLSSVLESQGVPIGGITADYANTTRNTTTPDIGAYEFAGFSSVPIISSVTGSAATCTATSHVITSVIVPGAISLTSGMVILNYKYNTTSQTPIIMTNSGGNNWTATIPAGPAGNIVSYSVNVNDGSFSVTKSGVSYTDAPLTGVTALGTATNSSLCVGTSTTLTVALSTGTIPSVPAATSYCASTHASGCSGDNISRVVLNTLDRTTGTTCGATSSAYSDFTGGTGVNTTSLTGGSTYNLSLTFGTDGSQYFGAWIDYNHDGTYSVGEFLGASANAGASGTIAVSFTVPGTAYNGLTHIRIVGGNDAVVTSGQACGASSSSFGETQDYDVTITGATSTVSYTGSITGYSWSDGATVVGATTPLTLTPPNATTSAVTINYTATVTALGCTVISAAVPVTVKPYPTAPTGSNSEQCGSAVPTATTATTFGTTTPTFNWYDATAPAVLLQSSTSISYTSAVGTTTNFLVKEALNGCIGASTTVTVNVNTPLSLTITSNKTICNAAVQAISVTSTASNYNQYTWSGPAGTLFSDNTGSTVYAGQTNLTTIYFKSTTVGAGTVSLASYNTTTLCGNAASAIMTVQPASFTLSNSNPIICQTGSSTFAATPSTGYAVGSLQWQSSVNGIAYGDISGQTGTSYTSPTITSSMFYRLLMNNGAGIECSHQDVTVTVNNPSITGTTPDIRCGSGTQTLSATASGSSFLNWYAASTGGIPLYTGATFTTPVISATTTYYVAASVSGGASSATIGTGTTLNTTTGYPSPYSNYYGGSKHQMLIKASELTAAGLAANAKINAISFTVSAVGTTFSGTLSAFQIDMKSTSSTVLNGTSFESGMTSGATTVFGPVSQTIPKTGLPQTVTHTLTTPFTWDGTSNIVIQTSYSNANSGTSTDFVQMPYSDPGFVSTNYYRADVATSSAILTGATPTGSGNPRPNMVLGIQSCESGRTAVVATVTTPTAITAATSISSICTGASPNLSVSAAGGYTGYTYIWSPGSFTGANYTPSSQSTTTKYYVNANDGLCTTIDSVTVTVQPTATITTSAPSICISGTSTLSANPSTGYAASSLQWQSSTDNVTFNDISGQTGVTYTTPTITSTTYYKLLVKNGASVVCSQPSVTMTVYSPQVATNTPATRCGVGSVTLAATPSAGATLSWYAASTGGTPLVTGNSYTTPSLSATTTYYVSAQQGGSTISAGLADNTGSYGTFGSPGGSGYGLYFTSTSPATINSVYVYPQVAGTCIIQLQDGSGALISGQTTTVTFVTGDVGVRTLVNLNFLIPGAGSYRLMNTGGTSYLGRYNPYSGPAYPLTSGPISITQGSLSTTTYYSFFGWSVSTGCESPRTAVVATVNTPPTITVTYPNEYVCPASTVNLSVASSNTNYVYVWTPGNLTGAAQSVNPTATTKYYVNASDAGTGCTARDSATISVQPTPTLSASGGGSICISGSLVLSANPLATYGPNTLQWQSSNDNTTFTDISGANSSSYTTPTITSTTYYKLIVNNEKLTAICSQPSITVTVNNPLVVTTAGASRCGPGTVNLSATPSSGATINWYAAATGGASLATGNSFSPSIIGTTTYYADASVSGGGVQTGLGLGISTVPAATGASAERGIVFTVNKNFNLISAQYYSPTLNVTNTVTVKLYNNGTGTQIGSSLVLPIVQGATAGWYTMNLNLAITTGITYRLTASFTQSVNRVSTGADYSSAAYNNLGGLGLITSGYDAGITAASYNYFHNISAQADACSSSPRTAVIASLTTAPALVAYKSTQNLCPGAGLNLYVGTADPKYTYTWTPGNITGSYITVKPTVTTKYFVNAVNATTGCQNVDSITVKVQPTATLGTNSYTICGGGNVTLNAIPATGYAVNSIQWQSSPNNSTWTNIAGATSSSYTTPALTTRTYYHMLVKDTTGGVCSQPSAVVNVNNALVTGTTPGSRCGPGTVTLGAIGSAGSIIKWYAAATGGSPLASGGSFVTPSLSTNTTYYVAAENSANVGNGTVTNTSTTYPAPFGAYFWGAKNQMLVKASELTAAGLAAGSISTLSFDVSSANASALTGFSISMKNTATSALTTTFEAGLSTVFSRASYTPPATSGLVTFTFDAPFTWDGTSNIIVQTCFNNGSFTNNAVFNQTTTTYNSTLVYNADNATVCTTTTGTVYTQRPNMKFGFSGGCQSGRSAVLATITTPVVPSVLISGSSTTCYGGIVTYTATPTNGGTLPVYQWKKGGVNVGTNSSTYKDAGTTGGVITCVMTSGLSCVTTPTATSNSITLAVTPNAWTGALSNNFSVAGNWCAGVVPTGAASVSIPSSAANMPKLYTYVIVNDLTLASGSTFDLNGYQLTINGTLSGAGYMKGSPTSTLILTGVGTTSTLNMEPATNSLKVLQLTGASTLTLGNALNMYDSVDVRAATLATGGFMTLKSIQASTARVGIITTGNVSGNVTVERWLRSVSRRTFRVLSVPTQGSQTIKQSWMENNAPLGNINPGYGTLLTSTFGVAQGYDATTTDNSMLRWNPTTSLFDYVGATSTAIATTGGYYVFIRGDRSVLPGGGPTTTTTLRTNGTLYQGTQSVISATGGVNTVIGNIYASAIDFTKLNTGITAFKIWDPALSAASTVAGGGAYQTFSAANGWVPSPGGGSYIAANTRIESGQAFIVSPGSTSTLTFTEYAKTTGSRQVQRQSGVIQRFKANLYAVNGGNLSLADGNVAVFDNNYSIGMDNYDVIKMNNFSENFGISNSSNSSHLLTIDARPEIVNNDEIQFALSNLQAQQYSFEFTTENLDATLTAYLVDNYLHTQTPITLNSTQSVSFKVSGDAASAAANRFKVVFKGTGTLPVTFTTIRANAHSGKVAVDWSVAGEKNIRNYTVEHSSDGRTFTGVGTVAATGNGAAKADYNWLHEAPVQGNNYYRIRSLGISGDEKYSTIARVFIGEGLKPSYVVAPNPVTDGNVTVQFISQPEGSYAVRLLNAAGQTVYSKSVNHAGGNSSNRIGLSTSLANGLYKLEILQPDKSRYVQNLVIGNSK